MKKMMDLHLLHRFSGYLKPHRTLVILSLVMIPFSIASTIIFPWLMIKLFDEKLLRGNYDGLNWLIFWLTMTLVVNYVSDAIYTYYLQKAGQLAIYDMRRDLFQRVLRLPRKYFDKTPVGITLSRLTSDTEAIGESFAMGVLSMIKDTINTLALLVFLFVTSWQLTFVLLLVFPPMYLISRYLRRKLRDMYNITRFSLSKAIGFLHECLNGIKTVQLYSAEQEVETKYKNLTHQFFKAQIKSNYYDAILFSVISSITSIAMGLIIWYGAGEVLAGVVSLGVLVAFINTLDKIFIPIRDFTSQIAAIQRALAAFEHIEVLFQQPLEEEYLEPLSSAYMQKELTHFESLEFKNVRFKYKEDNPYVLNGVSFKMNRGDQIALVGSTGSGKSTIIRLLNKIYDQYEGTIKVNGIELSRIPKQMIQNLFSFMQQDVFLFDESIAFNIGLEKETVSLEKVYNAAEYVYAHEFINELPEKYEFMLKENGGNLSSGQAQLISFARSIAGGSDLIMLDEATSSVDSVTEHLIQKAIDRLFQEKTVIAIAHRLSTIQHSDLILVLENGYIIERGTHQELLNLEGFYAKLINNDLNKPENNKHVA